MECFIDDHSKVQERNRTVTIGNKNSDLQNFDTELCILLTFSKKTTYLLMDNILVMTTVRHRRETKSQQLLAKSTSRNFYTGICILLTFKNKMTYFLTFIHKKAYPLMDDLLTTIVRCRRETERRQLQIKPKSYLIFTLGCLSC